MPAAPADSDATAELADVVPGAPAGGATEAPETAGLATDLRHAVLRLTRRLRSQRADISVTITQLMALGTLFKHGPMSAGELAAHERVQPPSMTKILVALEEHGLSRREQHPSDRRQIVIQVTDAGRELLEQEGKLRDAWLATQLATLTAGDRDLLARASEVMSRLATE
ncbi:MAG: transcriptional regulator, MarR family [Pseudonocardiales bacterium]|nr:transcriptional regulator, MarR family [Jatrophihabitantaceae bacterium]MCW2604117.1 transcriptional regulator, MarR family [Pseudonocardiales bacterium]